METKHTPGPWFVMNTSDVFTGLAAKAADGRSTAKDDGWHIAECAPGGSFVKGSTGLHELAIEEIKANARLIAAAPELLAALQVVNEALCDRPLMDPLVVQVRAAIAKAEGK